ncbi:MAG: hypothetical protein MR004_09990 [Clostridiales bacterium]|nr:hypothetical protein [bacterium 210917-SL.2.15]MCI5843950.1 hypothetical protein [Clostridiales bacterium]MDY4036311.1 hypothetical protein [Candidatus Pseudoscilispira sp.]
MKKKEKPGAQFRTVENKRLISALYILLRVSVVMVLIAQVLNGNFENVMLCVLTLILFTLPSLIERRLKIDLPDTLEIIILLFIYAAEILGEIRAFYVIFPFWDTVLHTMNGFLCAAIGFSLIDLLNRSKKFTFSLSPLYVAVVSFCFSMTVGVLWEFFECAMDQFFFLDMQKDTVVNAISSVLLDPAGGNHPQLIDGIRDVIIVHSDGTQQALGVGGYLDIGLLDTMEDLFVNFIGATVFSLVGYFYIKRRGQGKFARRFIPRVLEDTDSVSSEKDKP